jgi:hypothetical protein
MTDVTWLQKQKFLFPKHEPHKKLVVQKIKKIPSKKKN